MTQLGYCCFRTKSHAEVERYRAINLAYFEAFEDPYEAISREKQIKAGPRRKKVALIRKLNPRWRNLAEDF